ncbi:MAG TPA: S16 family serine protease, partial [Solirubrobacteraceae bacterium]|nr:S16 family serine protease [Solirubrobacteraceae bacterium]
ISGRPVRDDVAMTGEITLTGQVLPIGGLKEKALAAQRNGLTTIIAPALNAVDADELPEHLLTRMELVFVDEIGAVLDRALEPAARPGTVNGLAPSRPRAAAPGRRAARARP